MERKTTEDIVRENAEWTKISGATKKWVAEDDLKKLLCENDNPIEFRKKILNALNSDKIEREKTETFCNNQGNKVI